MLTPLRLSDLKIPADKNARQRTLDALDKFKKASAELERRCAELGIEVPKLVCC